MIKISAEHRKEIHTLLSNRQDDDIGNLTKAMTPILRAYHPSDPAKIGKRLLSSLFSGWLSKPEESIVHYWTICRLVHEYGYPPEHIDHEVSCGGLGRQAILSGSTRADIVVYSHHKRGVGTALVTIECREHGGINGEKQAASYSRALQSPFHLFTDSEVWAVFETQPHPADGLPAGNIPHWVGSKPLQQRLSKTHELPPMTDEEHLRSLIKKCHNIIHGEGVDPAKAFDELVKLFFVKLFDELEVPDVFRFSILAGETDDEVGENIRALLKEAKEKSQYRELFSEVGDDEFGIQNKSIRTVVETFQGFSFSGSSRIGMDPKGTAYENMVGATFRGEMGQYFTPRKIVEFMIDLLQPTRKDTILDPSCGSGGFLIYAMRIIANQIRQQQQNLPEYQKERIIRDTIVQNIRGTDLGPRMVRAARMNMIMHGDGWACIQRCHGLDIKNHPSFRDDTNQFSLILSNPPFAGYESDDYFLEKFSTGKNEKGEVRGVNKAIIFVEQIIRLLGEGGRAGIVLPRSIFENESYSFRKIRSLIFEHCEIIALVGLPRTAFHHTDCGILGDLMFLRKTSNPRTSYGVFVSWADQVGYNTLGHNIDDNDFPTILNDYQNEANQIPIETLRANDNLNPWFYHPDAERLREEVKSNNARSVPLTELVSIYDNKISKPALKQTPERRLRYFHVRDVDPATGNFTPRDVKASELPSRATYELTGEELILLPNARNSLDSVRRIIKIGKETQGMIMTNRFTPLIPLINIDYLVMLLNTPFVRDQLIASCRGAGSPDLNKGKLRDIMVPVPDSTDLSSVDVFMEPMTDMLAHQKQLEAEVVRVAEEIDDQLQSLLDS